MIVNQVIIFDHINDHGMTSILKQHSEILKQNFSNWPEGISSRQYSSNDASTCTETICVCLYKSKIEILRLRRREIKKNYTKQKWDCWQKIIDYASATMHSSQMQPKALPLKKILIRAALIYPNDLRTKGAWQKCIIRLCWKFVVSGCRGGTRSSRAYVFWMTATFLSQCDCSKGGH